MDLAQDMWLVRGQLMLPTQVSLSAAIHYH